MAGGLRLGGGGGGGRMDRVKRDSDDAENSRMKMEIDGFKYGRI